jgi:lipoate-protein ligase B
MELSQNNKLKDLNQVVTYLYSTDTFNSKPSKSDRNSAARNPKSTNSTPKHVTRISQPDTHNPQPETRNTHLVTRDSQHATRDSQPETRNPKPDCCYAVDLGRMDYKAAWTLQSDIVSARINGIIDTDIILFLEHPAVFTLGRRGGRDHLLVSEEFLNSSGIPIVQVERGGHITFHGPGQLVAYPIVNLKARRIGVVDFVTALEDIMLATAQSWGIAADRNPANRGIWVGNNKLGSIGLAIRKGISFHGLALNVNIDLRPFSWIQPCGLEGVCMTSMKQELGRDLSMDEVCTVVEKQFESVLDLNLTAVSFSHLQQQLQNQKNVDV